MPETPGFLKHVTLAMIGKGDVACGLDVSVLLSARFMAFQRTTTCEGEGLLISRRQLLQLALPLSKTISP